jgi:hypothetical protein
MTKIGLFILAGLAIVAIGWIASRTSSVREEKEGLKKQVQTWEDEGGNVSGVTTPGARINKSNVESSGRSA